MSEILDLPVSSLDGTSEPASDAAPPVPPVQTPSDPVSLVAMIAAGLAPDASPAARDAASIIWQRFSPMITALAQSQPINAPVLGAPALASAPGTPPLRLTPEQLGDVLIAKLRAQLPAGTTLQPPRGFQVQLIPPHLR